MDLLSEAPKEIFHTTPGEYLRKKVPGITFDPSENIYMSECKPFGLNWALMWSLSCVLTSYFKDTAAVDYKSYFGLKTADGKPFRGQTWRDGVRAGIQLVAAHIGKHNIETMIIYPGTKDAIKKPLLLKTAEDLDALFGEGVGGKTLVVYKELCEYAFNDEFTVPPAEGSPISLPEPKPIPPEIKPPVKEPVPKDPNAPVPTWKKWVKVVLGVASPFVLWLVGFVVPGPIMDIVKSIIAILKQLVGA